MINLITGATGFVGQNLIYKLLNNNEKIWVIIRDNNAKKIEERIKKKFPRDFEKIKVIKGDILRKDLGLRGKNIEELKKEEIMFWHLAANLSFATRDKDLVWRTNFDGTKNVVELADKISVKKIIYVSTAYVSGDFEGKILENKMIIGQKFRNNYEASKYQAEKYIRENFEKEILIIRPSIILGEVYTGKAEGCTFGYYRFSYMFYLFKLWIIKKMKEDSSFGKIILRLFGTKYDDQKDEIIVPWLVMFYVKRGRVDLVSVDYVVDSMIKINFLQEKRLETVHLTSDNPVDPKFLMELIFTSLGYRKFKGKFIPKWVYLFLVKIFYLLTFPVKAYTKSIYWYLPYFIREYEFSKKNSIKYNLEKATSLDEVYMSKINRYAKNEIFDRIKEPKL